MAAKGSTTQNAVAIRDFEPKDYEAIVAIGNALFPEHRDTVEEERHWDETFDRTRFTFRRYVATAPDGEVVGMGQYQHIPWAFDPRKYSMWVMTRPEWQRRGVGSALYDRILRELTAANALNVKGNARESMRESVAFLENRGFREVMRNWESRLDLTAFDPASFGDRAEPPEAIEIVSLAEELERDPGSLERVYELGNVVAPDVPRVDPFTPAGLETFRKTILEGPDAFPEAFLLAKDGDAYVAQSDIHKSQAMPDVLFTGFTGVRREYRGRGIAFALKVAVLTMAKGKGYREVRTWNSTENAPMLGINVALGFAKQPVWIMFEKDLSGGTG